MENSNLFKESKADALIIITFDEIVENVRFANNSLTTSGRVKDREYIFISIIGKKRGTTAISMQAEEKDLLNAIKHSEELALSSEDDEDFMPIISGDNESKSKDDIGLTKKDVDNNINKSDSSDIFLTTIQNVLERFSKDNVSGFGISKKYKVNLSTSTGVNKFYEGSYSSLGCTVKSTEFKSSSWFGMAVQEDKDIDSNIFVSTLGTAIKNSKNTLKLPAGDYDVILSPSCVADMAVYLISMMSRRDADEGKSPFSKYNDGKLEGNKLGEHIFSPLITMSSDPFKEGMEVLPFVISTDNSAYSSVYDNGMANVKSNWIVNGKLESLITPRVYAKKKGIDAVFYPGNISINGSNKTKEELISTVKRGLLVTTLWYIRMVDPMTGLLTGLTRDGVFVIEDGKVIGASNNFRFNMSPISVFKDVLEVSESEFTIPRESDETDSIYSMPYLLVKNFHMSSVSDAL